jgi:hypothetical protein
MSKIRIEFECNGDAKEFLDRVIEDYYQTAKNCDQETLEQYESIAYEVQDRPQLYADQFAKVTSDYDAFETYVNEQNTHADNAVIGLVGAGFELDGEELNDENFIDALEKILEMRRTFITRNYSENDNKCDSCKESALDDNACADHKGECYECCGCGDLEDQAAAK